MVKGGNKIVGLFFSKNLIAELTTGLLEKNRVFVSFKNVPNKDNIEIQPYIVYLFLLDKVLVNMAEKLSVATIRAVHTWGTRFMDQLHEIDTQEVWEKSKSKLKTPNDWTFTNTEEDFGQANFVATAKIFKKGKRIFCTTDFSRDQYIEAKVHLLVESLLNYIKQNLSLDDYSYYFLPTLLAQCSFYNEKRPGITQLGQAVYYGLEQAEMLRKKYGRESL